VERIGNLKYLNKNKNKNPEKLLCNLGTSKNKMTKKIKVENLSADSVLLKNNSRQLRVRVIKAPLVNTSELKEIIFARARALVL